MILTKNTPSKDTRIANLQFLLGSKIQELNELQGKFYEIQKELEEVKSASSNEGQYVFAWEMGCDDEVDDIYDDSSYTDRYDEFITLGMNDYIDLTERLNTGRIQSIHDLISEVQQRLREYNT